LDDIGATRNTDWAIQTITEIVAARYDDVLPTIVTSNLPPQKLADAGLERVVSRLAENGSIVSISSAKDFRMAKRRTVQ
jgi:DNA replication protein DnaC